VKEIYTTFSSGVAGRTRVPGILAGLKERSQSAYAAPAPNPVDSAMGHVRPVWLLLLESKWFGSPWETHGGKG